MALEEVESEMAQHREVFSAISGAEPSVIFPKRDVQCPVKGVFNRPRGTPRVQEQLSLRRKTGNDGGRYQLHLVTIAAFAFDHGNRL